MAATTPKMTHEEFMKKYNFSGNLRMAQWSNLPQYHPTSSVSPTSTVTAEAWRQAAKPTYRFIMPSPNLPQLTDDEDSAGEQETPAMKESSPQVPSADTEAPDEAMAALLAKLGLGDAATTSPPATTAEPAIAAVMLPDTNSKFKSKSKAKPSKSKSSLKSRGKSSKAIEAVTIPKVSETIVDVPQPVEEAAPASEMVNVPHLAEEVVAPASDMADVVVVPDTAAPEEDVVIVPEPESEPAAPEEDVVIVPEPALEQAAVEDIAMSSEPSAAAEEQVTAVDISPTADESLTSPETACSVTEALEPPEETIAVTIPDAEPAETTPATASDAVGETVQATQSSDEAPAEPSAPEDVAAVDVVVTNEKPAAAEVSESAAVEEAPESAPVEDAPESAPNEIDFDALLKSIEGTGGVDILTLLGKPVAGAETPDNGSTVASVESEDKHVSFAPGTPEPKPTKRKKKSKDASKPKRRSSISANDAAGPEVEAPAEIIATDTQEPVITPTTDDTVVVVVDNEVADAQSPVIEVPVKIADEKAVDAISPKKSSSKPKSSSKSTGLFAPGGLLSFGGKPKSSKSSKDKEQRKKKSKAVEEEASEVKNVESGVIGLGIVTDKCPAADVAEIIVSHEPVADTSEPTAVTEIPPLDVDAEVEKAVKPNPPAEAEDIVIPPVEITNEWTANTGQDEIVQERIQSAEDASSTPQADESTSADKPISTEDATTESSSEAQSLVNKSSNHVPETETEILQCSEPVAVEVVEVPQIQQEEMEVPNNGDEEEAKKQLAILAAEVLGTDDAAIDIKATDSVPASPVDSGAVIHEIEPEDCHDRDHDREEHLADSIGAVETSQNSEDATTEAISVDPQEEVAVETMKDPENTAAEAVSVDTVDEKAVEVPQELEDATTESLSVDAEEVEAIEPASELGDEAITIELAAELGDDNNEAITIEPPEELEDAIDAAITVEPRNELGDATNEAINVEPLREHTSIEAVSVESQEEAAVELPGEFDNAAAEVIAAAEAISADTKEDKATEVAQELGDAAAEANAVEPPKFFDQIEQLAAETAAATSEIKQCVLELADEEVEIEAPDSAELLQGGEHMSELDNDTASDAAHDAEPAVDESAEQTQASEPQAELPERVDAATVDAESKFEINTPTALPEDRETVSSIDPDAAAIAVDETVLDLAQENTVPDTQTAEVIAAENTEVEPSVGEPDQIVAGAATSAIEDAVAREDEQEDAIGADESDPKPLVEDSEPVQSVRLGNESSVDAIIVVVEPDTPEDATSILVYPPGAFEERTTQGQDSALPVTEQTSPEVIVDNTKPNAVPIITQIVVPEEPTTDLIGPPASPTFSRTSRRRRSSHAERPSSSRKTTEQSSSKEVRSKDRKNIPRSEDRSRRERRSTEEGSERRHRRDAPRSEDIRSIAEEQPPPEDEEHRRLRHEARRAARKAEEAEPAARRAREEADAIAQRDAEARQKRREQRPSERPSTKDSSEKTRPKLGSSIIQGLSSGQSVSRAGLLVRTQSDTRAWDTRDSTKRSGRDEEKRAERREGEGSKVSSAKDDARRSGADRAAPRHKTERDSTRRRDERKDGPTQSPTEQKDIPKQSDRPEGERPHRSRRTSDRGDKKSPTESKSSGFFGSFFKR